MHDIEKGINCQPNGERYQARDVWSQLVKAGVFILKGNRFMYVDNSCETISGCARDELLNSDFNDVFHPTLETPPPPEPRSSGKAKQVSQRYEAKLLTKGGEERWIAGELTPITSDGEPAILGTIFDITAHKVARDYVEANAPSFEQMFEEGPLGIALVGPDFCFLKVNPALGQMLGYSVEEITGRFFADLIHPEEVALGLAAAENLLTGKLQCLRTERRYVKKNGQVIWLGVTASSLRDRSGQVICGLAMFEDIGQRKRSEAEKKRYSQQLLNTLEEERRRIARELHDDIGQALAALALQLRVLLQDKLQGKGVVASLEQATREVEKTARAVAALARAYHPAELRNVGLPAAVRDFATSWARQHGLKLSLEISAPTGLLTAEQQLHLYRIVQEALNNVAKHAKASHVRVDMLRSGEALLIAIDDDGQGFDPDEEAGHGLGITTMRERAQIAGGKLAIKQSNSRGTRIEVTVTLSSGDK